MPLELPPLLTGLPMIDLPMEGIEGHLLQSDNVQGVFFRAKAGVFFPEHRHEVQWGVILEGEFEITIDGMTTRYGKGDTYFIPEGVLHSGRYRTDALSFDVFGGRDKFRKK
ncbi:cupin domain-containing protein [Desulfovibrio aminophilus]|nr:cupin domain-containing protein [Desulfovibrio aminophilus]MCM0755030.1 cupin domain-containing protein [Desulfovibrio aminophilus]